VGVEVSVNLGVSVTADFGVPGCTAQAQRIRVRMTTDPIMVLFIASPGLLKEGR